MDQAVVEKPADPAAMTEAPPERDERCQLIFGVRPVRGGFICESVVILPADNGEKVEPVRDMEVVAGRASGITGRRVTKVGKELLGKMMEDAIAKLLEMQAADEAETVA